MAFLEGSKPRGEYLGVLHMYRSLSEVQDRGIEWALKQSQDRLDRNDPPLATEKDRDAAFDWPKSKPEQDDVWSYMISNGSEILVVSAEEFEGGGSGCDDNGRQ